ncbi:23S rRNA (pseudouridine(1915)-N(3))-methyltransferase RlmH [Streptococcus chenjunshii]|uniref:Ribosomal RNA large subunit methyltransferase H n=1 Tax=Streptococcus chenjunshii TaxID=2173853 RepID=A0A372KJL5_9STRE|nr:23S rRNA (pseudouridine(1915)-N(3))-methyltransferase RlmH [Streptococcus chenjunshii]AXQ79670.1 23S rRNA (pseudouridine(1915)-N(3))-methyltransferase RlmH [Streptococcus chenjunshii]RFU50290.1 23S rRNA (pseudouridine(1915)-N(3))-methyltransferase RlmH [Streptococcus chenjunshii]RFU52502.1 23S rRNA (pseudouridine(1915)-N(3))-methyltransferase RlmH [Streptococcus chenjunshii]
MKVKLIAVGKLKENYLREGVSEYIKRLNAFAKIEIIELADEQTPNKASQAEKQKILDKEAKRILAKLGSRDYVVALAIEGKQLSSEAFSQLFETFALKGYSDISFVIGGSLGLAPVVKSRADLLISFGLLTLPHQLMRLVLAEQIYRAFMIQQGRPYHK